MRMSYRIPGLEQDHLSYVEHLATDQFPPEQYCHISVLASHSHGLGNLFQRLGACRDPRRATEMVEVILHILKFCLKTDECRGRLISPDLK